MSTPAFDRFERGLREVHRFILAGQGDSDEADAVREAMSCDYRHLSPIEEAQLDALSEALYLNPDAEVPPATSEAVARAVHRTSSGASDALPL